MCLTVCDYQGGFLEFLGVDKPLSAGSYDHWLSGAPVIRVAVADARLTDDSSLHQSQHWNPTQQNYLVTIWLHWLLS